MTQEERWKVRYQEVKFFIETNHRNPSKYVRLSQFLKLLELSNRYKRVNQWV